MSETPPETPAETAPELTDPVGLNGNSLMGIQPWPSDVPPEAPVTAPPAQTPAELRAQAERLLAEADSLENTGM